MCLEVRSIVLAHCENCSLSVEVRDQNEVGAFLFPFHTQGTAAMDVKYILCVHGWLFSMCVSSLLTLHNRRVYIIARAARPTAVADLKRFSRMGKKRNLSIYYMCEEGGSCCKVQGKQLVNC